MRPATPAHPVRSLVLAVVLLAPPLVATPSSAATAVAGLEVSDTVVGLGESVTLTANIEDTAGCLDGRTVVLEWRPAGSAGFAQVASAITAPDGRATFRQAQSNTGRYRASVQASGGCPVAASAEVPVRVRAQVDASVVTGSGRAGTCVDVAASVRPARPGQVVDLQRRSGGGWSTLEQLVLDDASKASASPCFGFDDIGVTRIRIRWVAQDPLNETAASAPVAFEIVETPWMEAIGDAIGGRAVSVAVGEDGTYLYRHADATPRIPASNEKLLLSMAMLDAFGPDLRMRTSAEVAHIDDRGVVDDLWIVGRGDPRVTGTTLGSLARELADAGVTRVRGRVLGSTGYFRRDWNAHGWNDQARDFVNRPTALTLDGNDLADPERRAAGLLADELEALGIRVAGEPGSDPAPNGLRSLASVVSKPLRALLIKMLRPSDNFTAEVLGKRLGVRAAGQPGTIAKGAAAIEAFARGNGADFTLFDNSGLSYADRITAEGMVRLLWVAEDSSWHEALLHALPTGGQGTLRDRLHRVRIRAKTGTLTDVSALSGWVFASGTGTWVEFSILSSGMSKQTSSKIEDEIVRILAGRLRGPSTHGAPAAE